MNNISIRRIISETSYILGEFYRLFKTIYLWKELLNQAEYENIDKKVAYPSFYEMKDAIIGIQKMLHHENILLTINKN